MSHRHRLKGASAEALVHFVPAASGAPASSAAGPPSEDRDWPGQAMEEARVFFNTQKAR
jgi:hypothetical protein